MSRPRSLGVLKRMVRGEQLLGSIATATVPAVTVFGRTTRVSDSTSPLEALLPIILDFINSRVWKCACGPTAMRQIDKLSEESPRRITAKFQSFRFRIESWRRTNYGVFVGGAADNPNVTDKEDRCQPRISIVCLFRAAPSRSKPVQVSGLGWGVVPFARIADRGIEPKHSAARLTAKYIDRAGLD